MTNNFNQAKGKVSDEIGVESSVGNTGMAVLTTLVQQNSSGPEGFAGLVRLRISEILAGEPAFAACVKSFDFGALQARADTSNFVTDLRLEISKVTITGRKTFEPLLIDRHRL